MVSPDKRREDVKQQLLNGAGGGTAALNEELKDWYFASDKVVDSCDYERMVKPQLPPMPSGSRKAARSESPMSRGRSGSSKPKANNANGQPRRGDQKKSERSPRPPVMGQRVQTKDDRSTDELITEPQIASLQVESIPAVQNNLVELEVARDEVAAAAPQKEAGPALNNADAINDWLAEANLRLNAVFAGTPAAIEPVENKQESKVDADPSIDNNLQCVPNMSCIEEHNLVATIKEGTPAGNVDPRSSEAGSVMPLVDSFNNADSEGANVDSVNLAVSHEQHHACVGITPSQTSDRSAAVGSDMAPQAGHTEEEPNQGLEELGQTGQRSEIDGSLQNSRKGLGATNASYGDDFEDFGSEDDAEAESGEASDDD